MQEMTDQDTAYFIVVPLFLFWPGLAFRIIEFSDDFEAFFIGVMP